MRGDAERRRSALVLLAALDVLEAATQAVGPEVAVDGVRGRVSKLSEDEVRDVAVALAIEAVWNLPPALLVPRTAGERRERLRQLGRWIRALRLEASWLAS